MVKARIIGLIGLGDMGGAVGRSLVAAGHDVRAVFEGRGKESLERARSGGLTEVTSLAQLVDGADVVLSIVPPGIAAEIGEVVAGAIKAVEAPPLFADLNAIAPDTSRSISAVIEGAGGRFADGGIIGASPYKTSRKTRIYLSGKEASDLAFLSTDEIDARVCGPEIGQASGLKMVYAALTKGTASLQAAVMLAAEQMGLTPALVDEFGESQADRLKGIRGSVPFLAADSVRWADEMDEIAKSFAAVGVTPKFHEGAGDLFRLLAKTPLEAETRATADYSRTLEEALAIYAAAIGQR